MFTMLQDLDSNPHYLLKLFPLLPPFGKGNLGSERAKSLYKIIQKLVGLAGDQRI